MKERSKYEKSKLGRKLAALRTTHGGPHIKPGTPEEMEHRRRRREAQKRWRQNTQNKAGIKPNSEP